jgi:ATPase subunit of ABC transporter with duplicated ATPase domains
LDPESVNALNIRLQKYDGTLLPLTHDHDVVEEVATWIWSIDPGKIEDFLAKKESARA